MKDHLENSNTTWQWGELHSTDFPNIPWSLTPLKPIFHKEVFGQPGNKNTVSCSHFQNTDLFEKNLTHFQSTHTAVFKQIVDLSTDGTNMIVDSGIQGNRFGTYGNYFDMNGQLQSGKLLDAKTKKVFDHEVLTLTQKSQKSSQK